MDDDYAFKCRGDQKGFWMTFKNGYTVSVQFMAGNYCDEGKTTAEMAAWDKAGDWYVPESWTHNDDIKGWNTPEEVAAFISEVASK